jgi:predicted transcriptional regulator
MPQVVRQVPVRNARGERFIVSEVAYTDAVAPGRMRKLVGFTLQTGQRGAFIDADTFELTETREKLRRIPPDDKTYSDGHFARGQSPATGDPEMNDTGRVVTAKLPDDLVSRMDEVADRIGRTKSWIVRQAVSEWLAEEQRRYELTLEALKSVDEGRTIPHEEVLARVAQRQRERREARERSTP